MSLRYCLQHVRQFLNRRRPRRPMNFRVQLRVEGLEERTVPSILYGTDPMLTTVSDGGGPVINNAHVDLIFWGTGWGTASGSALRTNMQSAVDSILSGPYTSSLSQYRPSIGSGYRAVTHNITSSSPPSVFSNADVNSMLKANIASGALPSPDSDSQLLYMVITQPGSSAGSAGGLHTYIDYGPGHNRAHYGWTINNGYLDTLTYFFSHETAEAVTDPEGSAIQVNPRNPSSWNEICDGDAQHYSYRLDGYRVQAYWSQLDHRYVVPTGQVQNFFVSAWPNLQLTVVGDQLSSTTDTIIVDLNSFRGVRVTLNGEVAQFEPNAIGAVNIFSGGGNDKILVWATTASSPVSITSSGNATVNIGNLNRLVQDIQGQVTIQNPPSYTTVNVIDSGDPYSRTVTLDSIALSDSTHIDNKAVYGQITFSGSAPIQYKFADTSSVTVQTGLGGATVNVLSTGVATTLIGNGYYSDVVNVGNSYNGVQSIQGTLTVRNPPSYTTLNISNCADSANHAVYESVDSSGMAHLSGLAPAMINFRGPDVSALSITTGSGVTSFYGWSSFASGPWTWQPPTYATCGGSNFWFTP
jgi:hypothetical protein